MNFPTVIGHRGAAGIAPENTLVGFRRAAQVGVPMVEYDVKLTADNRCILFHDDTLDRTTDGAGPVKDRTLEEISALDAGLSFSRAFAGEAVPTLEEAIDLLTALRLLSNLEIKPCPGREEETARIVLETAQACWPADYPPPLVSSFSMVSMKVAKEVAPDWPRGLLLERLGKDWQNLADDLGVVTVHPRASLLTKRKVQDIKEKGLNVLAWTVNDILRAKELAGWGVDGVFTDAPQILLAANDE